MVKAFKYYINIRCLHGELVQARGTQVSMQVYFLPCAPAPQAGTARTAQPLGTRDTDPRGSLPALAHACHRAGARWPQPGPSLGATVPARSNAAEPHSLLQGV